MNVLEKKGYNPVISEISKDVLSERRKDGYFLAYVCSRNERMFLNNSDKEFVLLNKIKGKVNYSPNL